MYGGIQVTYMKDNCKEAKKIFTVLFIVIILGYSFLNIFINREQLLEKMEDLYQEQEGNEIDFQNFLQNVEGIINDELLFRLSLVEVYSAMQMVTGKHEDNAFDIVKGKDGMLYNGNFWKGFGEDQKELAVRTRRLYDQLVEEGIQMGVVLYPMKTANECDEYYGLPYDDYTEIAEMYSRWIRYYNVPMLSLLDLCEESDMTMQEAFFSTDHHWTPQAAFEGYIRIVNWMNENFQAGLDQDGVLRNYDSYVKETYSRVMLGSQGRKTGRLFSEGLEDMTIIYPQKKGSYTLKRGDLSEYEMYECGFSEALLEKDDLQEKVIEDIYAGYAERVYLHSGVDTYVSIENHDFENDQKILLLRDSFSTPIGAFLAQSFKQVDMLWFLEISEEELEVFLEENKYDYVLVAIYPTNLTMEAFPYGMMEDE